jgi:hypothetical protein
MAIDSRSRMISVRLTPDEYETLRRLCFERGMDSLPEMSRAGLNLIQTQSVNSQPETLAIRVSELENRIKLLYREIKKMPG